MAMVNKLLKVRAKELACVPRILRLEEDKLRKREGKIRKNAHKYTNEKGVDEMLREHVFDEFKNLHKYRDEVRFEARAVNLARGLLRGHVYLTVENSTKSSVEQMEDLAEAVSDLVFSFTTYSLNVEDVMWWMGIGEAQVGDDNVSMVRFA